ncbi:N-acetyltransferase B complex, non-catalytic subunit [Niveomyces insectorum RCEF 264]|uniref:N-acetyltransferase B complex, non-catalytic subunit n=1 Tax=Niveomyces insectorum RCEF 264 TaxID=1081102 RepID=A0A167UN87_9HYPO|nr:N-acetyltransferase B complex, non-catalytic subunit [Niveomyces insectorum RCEF 264]
MSSFGHRPRPALKNGVDFQLQTAFADENWTAAVRLADKRAKSSSDPYYEVVKHCAESKLDGLADKSAAAAAVDAWVRQGVVPRDLESVELYEWACADARLLTGGDIDGGGGGSPSSSSSAAASAAYAATFGTLRLRWVKANPRNVAGGIASLKECLLHWDLVNAQQIATVLDKSSNANDRRFMFWATLLTHLLSTSPQCPQPKQKIYGMLAQKQLDKAAELAETQGLPSGAAQTAPPATSSTTGRTLRDEEEFLLHFRVLAAHGSPDDVLQCAQRAHTGAVPQFVTLGRKQLFLEVLGALEAAGQWDAVFAACREALDAPTDHNGRSPTAPPSMLACDLRIWQSLVAAAQQSANPEEAFDTVQALLNRYITAAPRPPPMYTRNLGLALLHTVFSLPPSLLPAAAEGASTPRVQQLLVFIEANLAHAAVFGDVRTFVERLSFAEADDLLQKTAALQTKNTVLRDIVGYKLRYLLTTCPQTRWPRTVVSSATTTTTSARTTTAAAEAAPPGVLPQLACKFCRHPARPTGCAHCLQAVATGSLQLHSRLCTADACPGLDRDAARVDLALVAASCLLRLAGYRYSQASSLTFSLPSSSSSSSSSLSSRGPQLCNNVCSAAPFLQAIAVLDAQHRQTPDDPTLRLLLVRAYVVLGCAAHALPLWTPLHVQRTVLDALGPLFYDRLASVAPGAFAGRQPLLAPLQSYFRTVLRHPSSVNLWDAFAAGSYSSILDMAAFRENLERSCTRVLAVVEERRAARALGGKLEDVEGLPVFADITSEVTLVNATDYGSIPSFESSHVASLAETLSLGPGLSDARMHLGLLSERYLDLVTVHPAKEYRPAKPKEAAARERVFLLDSLDRVQCNLMDVLHRPGTPSHLTAAEWAYYTIVSLLAAFAAAGIASSPVEPPDPTVFHTLKDALATTLDVLRTSVLANDNAGAEALFRAFTNLHGVGLLRDAAVAVRQTMAFFAAFQERETARDRSGRSGVHKDVLAAVRAHQGLGTKALADVQAHIAALKKKLEEPDWLDRIGELVKAPANVAGPPATTDKTGGDELSRAVLDVVGGSAAVENWVGHLLDGWREAIKGWGMVRFE